MKNVALVLLVVALLVAAPVMAKSDIGLKAVGARVGYIMPEDPIESTLGFGAHADLGTLMPNLTLHGYLDYWSKSYDEGTYWEASYSVIGISAIAKYHFEMDGNIKPYAGGGLGFNIGTAKAEYTGPTYGYDLGDTDASESNTDLGLTLVGGAAMELSPSMDGFVELRYSTDGADYFGIYAGISYKLK
jgi:opacity protein-like surface antigen